MALGKAVPFLWTVCLALVYFDRGIVTYIPKLCNRESGLQPTRYNPHSATHFPQIMSKVMKKRMNGQKMKNSALPYYGVAVLWLLIAVLQRLDQLPLAIALSVGVFVLLRIVTQRSEPSPAPPQTISVGNTTSQFEKVMQKGTSFVQSLDLMTRQIQDAKVCGTVAQLSELGEKILREVHERPEKAQNIATFVNYYVPTTLNILNVYRRAEAAGIEGENISKTKHQIESVLESSILTVFHRQLDSLFGADSLDISLELSVLEEMMLREGITGEKLEAETTKNADGADINLTL